MTIDSKTRAKEATKVTLICVVLNVILTIFKFIAGIFGRSSAMVADAVHSLSDFASDIAVILGFKAVKKPKDKSHDYGHGKFETLITAIIGVMLLFVGVGILISCGWKVYNIMN